MMYEVRGEHGENQCLSVADCTATNDATFPTNEWMHISLVHRSDGTASIFWNGHPIARGPVHLPQRVPRQKYYVGRSHWHDDPYFQGEIAELHVFDYALSDGEVYAAARCRLPSGTNRGGPIVSLAHSWCEIDSPLQLKPQNAISLMAHLKACERRGCAGNGNCASAGVIRRGNSRKSHEVSLHYHVVMEGERAQGALQQLHLAIELHREQLSFLARGLEAAHGMGATRKAHGISEQITTSIDALHRAQTVSRMIRYGARMPTDMRHDVSTGQMRQPPRIAAAMDPLTGMYQAFAIYELRSGDSSKGSRFHVYINDIFNMRCLLPFWSCWRPMVGSLLISLLQRKAEAEQEVVVLRALDGAPQLVEFYEKLGFTSKQRAFEDEGLHESWVAGDLLFI